MELFNIIERIYKGNPPKKIRITDINEQENDTFTWNGTNYINEEDIKLDEALDILYCLYYDVEIIEE